MRAQRKVSASETHCLVNLLQLLYDGVLRNGRPSKVGANIHECWERAGDESLDTLQCCCGGIGISVEEEGVAWLLGRKFPWKGQDIVMVGRMRFGWVRGEKVEAKRVDDEENGAVVGGW